jgi:hypothetical protein
MKTLLPTRPTNRSTGRATGRAVGMQFMLNSVGDEPMRMIAVPGARLRAVTLSGLHGAPLPWRSTWPARHAWQGSRDVSRTLYRGT